MKGCEVVITGIGLVSSLGEGQDAHWAALESGARPHLESTRFAPYCVHPMAALDLDRQIPKKGDQRQMEPWQRIGVYAAGLALQDADLKGNEELLAKTHMIVAAGGGERDIGVDEAIMSGLREAPDRGAFLNERLSNDLRPTLFLAQLSNLLAGNISIVHGVVGSSRTFMGEEAAGLDAIRTLHARIACGQAELGLVGGAYNCERKDMLLLMEFANGLLKGTPNAIWGRAAQGGGAVMGSLGAFLVLESADHARVRGAQVLAKLSAVLSDRTPRKSGDLMTAGLKMWRTLQPMLTSDVLGVLSGASGVAAATAQELELLGAIGQEHSIAVRATGTVLGHALEAQAPANVALAALALSRQGFFAPFDASGVEDAVSEVPSQILVTNFGHWRGEGLALVEAI